MDIHKNDFCFPATLRINSAFFLQSWNMKVPEGGYYFFPLKALIIMYRLHYDIQICLLAGIV